MKRTKTDRPVLSWCLITRNCAADLERCLKSIRAMTPEAEIVIVDTMSNDYEMTCKFCNSTRAAMEAMKIPCGAGAPGGEHKWLRAAEPKTVEIAKRYADVFDEYTGPNGTWTRDMYAFDDAAAARNKALELANGQWIGWIDADDELLGPEETQRLLAVNGYLQKGVEKVEGLDTKTEEAPAGLPSRTVASLEDFLVAISEASPEITCFSCPYLYRFALGTEGEKGKAAEWQIRERFVKVGENGVLGWRWHRKAHEYLAPDDQTQFGGVRELRSLLFVHRKKWTQEDLEYSIKRHYNIIRKDFDEGRRDFGDLRYLVTYAASQCPSDLEMLMEELCTAAFGLADRAQALTMRGQWLVGRGFVREGLECLASAQLSDPSYPETYFAFAQAYEEQERWDKAVEWYMKGVKVAPTHAYSRLPPREHLVVNRIKGAVAAMNAARAQPQNAEMFLRAAVELCEDAAQEPGAATADGEELKAYLGLFRNELRCFQALRELERIGEVLKENDETLKAAKLVDCLPHNVVDHPIAQRMAAFAAKIRKHETDQASYTAFYESEVVTGEFADERMLLSMSKMPRVVFMVEQLKMLRSALGRPLRVLEVGPWDGPALLPAMEALPDSAFTVIEVQKKAIERLCENAKAKGVFDRLVWIHGMLSKETIGAAVGAWREQFDAVIFFEVLEHLPDTRPSLELLLGALKSTGRLFISTPWGAYDRGYPPNMSERDARGHVTAMMPRDVVGALESAGFRVLELGGRHLEGNYSDTIHAMAEPMCETSGVGPGAARATLSPQFVVSQALWPWNASHVERTGIGASEETIVFLAREFGRRGGRPQVYGPMPRVLSLDESEVRDGVAYWPKEQIRHLDPRRPIIISRAPDYWRKVVRPVLESFGKKITRKPFLWLQDCYYPDLTPDVANDYEKIVVLSDKHAAQIRATGIDGDKLVVIPNFLLHEHFPSVPSKCGVVREPHRLIYCSSPDRGLITLLKIWPQIHKRWPDATLGVFYGWQGAAKLGSAGTPEWLKMYRTLRKDWDVLKRQPGIEEYGRVNHATIAMEMRRASVWAYPIFNSQVETFCSNAIKARAAGCVPVVTAGMIPPEAIDGSLTQQIARPAHASSFSTDPGGDFAWEFVKGVERAFEADDGARDLMAQFAIERFELSSVFERWESLLGLQ